MVGKKGVLVGVKALRDHRKMEGVAWLERCVEGKS